MSYSSSTSAWTLNIGTIIDIEQCISDKNSATLTLSNTISLHTTTLTWSGGNRCSGEMRYGEEYKISSQSELSTILSSFIRDGYDLTGWIDSSGNEYSLNQTITPTDNLYLSSQWKHQDVNVFFYMDDRTTLLKNETVEYGKSATPPTATKEYYDLSGWEGSYTNVSSDTSCYAIFTKRFLTNETTILDMSSHIMTGTSSDIEHTCDEINPGVCCLVKGEYVLLHNSEDYSLTYENNYVKWTGLHVGDVSSQVAQVKVTGNGYYSGMVSTDFTISYERNGLENSQ